MLNNVFRSLLDKEYGDDMRLGHPLRDPAAIARRTSTYAALRGGAGFRTPKKSPRVHENGMTRGEMKRAAHAAFLASNS